MKTRAIKFIFSSYSISREEKKALFNYRVEFEDGSHMEFTETIVLPGMRKVVSSEVLDAALSTVHLALGISYYKMHVAHELCVESASLTEQQASFWTMVYHKGLGEFCCVNDIKLDTLPTFPHIATQYNAVKTMDAMPVSLVGIGGGKDSIVALEILRSANQKQIGFVVETQKSSSVIDEVISEAGIDCIKVKRFLDEQVFTTQDVFNGHVPISAIIASLGVLTAVCLGHQEIVVGNEYSSNFGNRDYDGVEINHQWSKTWEFEKTFHEYITNYITPSVNYFSLLRPMYEIRIAQIFARYPQYFKIFSSSNDNFRVHKDRPDELWNTKSPKTVFVFILLAAFLTPKELLEVFGENLYEREDLEKDFADVLGFGDMKPFECVGTFDEAQVALYLAREHYSNTFIVKQFLEKIVEPEQKLQEVMQLQKENNVPDHHSIFLADQIMLVGYGVEGKASEAYIQSVKPQVDIKVLDDTSQEDDVSHTHYDLAIKSPGIHKESMNGWYTTATNIFFSYMKNYSNKIIGVTGTKGKGTTASMITHILRSVGHHVILCGNIGRPMLETLNERKDDTIYVVELSSYQLDDIRYSPDISVVTNIYPEHLDFHGGMENYIKAKRNICLYQKEGDSFFYNGAMEVFDEWIQKHPGQVFDFQKAALSTGNHPVLHSAHLIVNAQAAIGVTRLFDISDTDALTALESFEGLPHRLQYFGDFQGIDFYDDAASTTPESTIAAIDAVENLETIFLGGTDRGYDYSSLVNILSEKGVKNVVLFPDTGSRIKEQLSQDMNVLETSSMKEAVDFAFEHTTVGKACLLSTAAPSYSIWKNFVEKGTLFQKYVKESV